MRRLFLIFLLSLTGYVYSAGVEKAFKALRIYDYFLAKKYFYKSVNKQPAPASFGLATIYFRADNPFHNYDSAYKYVMQARFSFNALKPEKKLRLKKFGVTDSTIFVLEQGIFRGGFEDYSGNAKVAGAKADSIFEKYLDLHFFSTFREDALKERDSWVFSSVKKRYHSKAFEQYILSYPESYFLTDAFYLWDKTLYEESTPSRTVKEFRDFIASQPNNRFVRFAQDEQFFIHKKNRDREGLIAFIKTYPQNEHNLEAWKLFFTLSVDKYTPENLAEFVLDYPEFPLRATIIEEINLLNKKLLRVHTGDRFGFIDTAGNMVIAPSFEEAEEFSEGLAIASEGEKYGYIDKNGKWAVKAIYDEAEPFHDGVAIVRQNKKTSLIDRTGVVISDEFDEVSDFSEGLAVIKKNGKYGAVNRLGNYVIPTDYDKLGDFKNGHAWFEKEGKFGIIDRQNFINIYNQFEWVDDYGEAIRARKNGFYGVISKTGEVLIPFEFERIEKYTDQVYVVVKAGKYGVMDSSGCYYINPDYDFDPKWKAADLISGNLVKLYEDGSQALISLNGKMLADFDEFEEVYLPSGEFIRYMKRDKYGFNDLKMHAVFKGSFDEATDFVNGFAIVSKKDKNFIIDKTGNSVFAEPNDEIERFEQDYFLVTRSGMQGLLDEKLNWLIQPAWQEIARVNDHFFDLKKNGKSALFDLRQNKIIWSE
jgi:hypothetical protein